MMHSILVKERKMTKKTLRRKVKISNFTQELFSFTEVLRKTLFKLIGMVMVK